MPENVPAAPAWHYASGRQKVGPLTFEQLRARAETGELRPADMVLAEGSPRWVAAADVAGLFGDPPPATPTVALSDTAGRQTEAYTPPADANGEPLPSIPGYEVHGVLGRGGMGVVYQALQLSLKRVVALKTIRGGGDADGIELARFRAEAEALARLQHPNIVQIYEVGAWQGQPYFALEFVAGGTLRERLAGAPVPAVPAAQLAQALARAVAAAHERGVVHRDLKPANVLLAGGPDAPLAPAALKITDFGLARRLDDDSGQTTTGAILGTPSYMAPEQAEGRTHEAGPLADVYALGAILYELLTGRPPFRAATVLDTLEQVRRQEPVPPSRLQPRVPRDVEIICLKCLQKAPARRYETATALADDLGRFLAGEPIRARPTPAWERAGKWVQRHPALAALYGLAVTAVAVVLAVILVANGRLQERNDDLTRARDREADANRRAVEKVVRLYVGTGRRLLDDGDLHGSLPWFAAALAQDHRDDPGPEDREREAMHRTRLGALLRYGPRLARVWSHREDAQVARFSPDGRFVLVVAAREARLHETTGDAAPRAAAVEGTVDDAVFDPGGKRLFLLGSQFDKQHPGRLETVGVWAWPLAPGAAPVRLAEVKVPYASLRRVSLSPDGRRLAALVSSGQALPEGLDFHWEVHVWDTATGRPAAPPLKQPGSLSRAAFSPDGRRLLTVTYRSRLAQTDNELWDVLTGRRLDHPLTSAAVVTAAAFAPDGAHLITGHEDGTAVVWDRGGGVVTRAPRQNGPVTAVAFTPDGRRVATAANLTAARAAPVSEVRVWNASKDPSTYPIWRESAEVRRLTFAAAGRSLAAACSDGSARVWDLRTETAVTPPLLQGAAKERRAPLPAGQAALSPDGRYLLQSDGGPRVSLWDLAPCYPGARELGIPYTLGVTQLSAGGKYLLAVSSPTQEGAVQVWDLDAGRPLGPAWAPGGPVLLARLSADGRRVVTVAGALSGPARVLRVWSAAGVPAGPTLAGDGPVWDLALSPDGGRVAVVDQKHVSLWEAGSGRLLWRTPDTAVGVVFSPDARYLATFGGDGTPSGARSGRVRVREAASGQAVGPELSVAGLVKALAFRGDGRQLAAGLSDGTAWVWEVETGRPVAQGLKHRLPVTRLAWAPAGDRLATSCEEFAGGEARVWDVAGARPLTAPLARQGLPAFSPDGRLLATVGPGDTARVWDAGTGEPVTAPLRHPDSLKGVAFGPDGRHLVAFSPARRIGNGARRWRWELPAVGGTPEEVARRVAVLTGRRVDAAGGLVVLRAEEFRTAWESARAAGQDRATRQEVRDWHAQAAAGLLADRDWPRALAHLDWLVKEEPSAPEHSLARALARLRLGRQAEALADCERARGLGLTDWRLWARQAEAHSRLGRSAEAAADYTEVLKAQPANPLLWFQRCQEYAALGRWPEARADLARCRALGMNTGPWYLPVAWYIHALLRRQAGDAAGYREACAGMRERFRPRIGPVNYGDEHILIVVHAHVLGACPPAELAGLIRQAEGIVARQPRNPGARLLLGALLYRAGRAKAAVERLNEVVTRGGGKPVPLAELFLALAYHQMGQAEQARHWLSHACKALDAPGAIRPPAWNQRLELVLLRREAEAACRR